MTLKIGTFNLNNLFSRFDFEADVATATTSTVMTRTSFTFADPSGFYDGASARIPAMLAFRDIAGDDYDPGLALDRKAG